MKKLLKTIPYIAIALLVGVTAVSAVDKLTSPGPVSNTMYSLTDIWNLATGTTTTEGTGTIATTPGTISETGKTLTEVYNAIKTQLDLLATDKIAKDEVVFGKTGTLYGDTDPSKVLTTATYPGTAISGPATLTWQTDPALPLCWDNTMCSVGSGLIQTPDTLTTLGAVEYCKYLNADGITLANTEQNIWRLPTIQEYQSITDFTVFDNATQVSGFAESNSYWTGTQNVEVTSEAWCWNTKIGDINVYNKNYDPFVRCVH